MQLNIQNTCCAPIITKPHHLQAAWSLQKTSWKWSVRAKFFEGHSTPCRPVSRMSYNDKKRARPHGGHEGGGNWRKHSRGDQQQGRKHSRGPADISTYKCTVRSTDSLRSEVPPSTHWLSIRDIDVSSSFGSILNPRAPICTLVLQSIHFTTATVPQDLITFILRCETLQEIQFNKNNWSSSQWSAIIDALLKTESKLKSLTFWRFQGDINQLISVSSLPYLSKFIVDSVPLDLEQVKRLMDSSQLEKLEIAYCDFTSDMFPSLALHLETRTHLPQQIILNGVPQETSRLLETKLTLLASSIITKSSRGDITPFIRDKEASEMLQAVGLGAYHETKTASHNFHPNVLAAFPAPGSTGDMDFDLLQFSCIVVEQPDLENDASVSKYLQLKLMPILLLCLSRLARNGYIIVLESSRIGLLEALTGREARKCPDEVNAEMVKRMNALFELSRVGLTVRRAKSGSNSSNGALKTSPDPDIALKVWTWKKIGTSLEKEYSRFLKSHELYAEIGLSSLSAQQKRELQQIFEQWFMLRANGEDADEYAHSECLKKRILDDSRDAWRWIDDISRSALELPYSPPLTVRRKDEMETSGKDSSTWGGSSGGSLASSSTATALRDGLSLASQKSHVSILSYGQFQESLQKSRVDALVRAAERNGSNHPLEDVMVMLLRYGAVFANFRQFCTNEELFQELVDAGVNCEGFASPFNAQILLMSPPSASTAATPWNPTFCSCYEDTDAPFGARGSFFFQTFRNLQVFLNPPTVEAVLDSTMEFIEQQMEKYDSSFHLLIPPWQDLKAYQMAKKSRKLSNIRHIDTSRYPSQNPYSGESHPSKKQFDLIFFKS